MTKKPNYSRAGFYYGIISVGILVAGIVIIQLNLLYEVDFGSALIGLLFMAGGFMGVLGLFKSISGIKEPNTPQKIIGILMNGGIVLLFAGVIIANIIDIYRAFA